MTTTIDQRGKLSRSENYSLNLYLYELSISNSGIGQSIGFGSYFKTTVDFVLGVSYGAEVKGYDAEGSVKAGGAVTAIIGALVAPEVVCSACIAFNGEIFV